MKPLLPALWIIGAIALLIVLPFVFRRDQPLDTWQASDPVLIVITPHNEAIRTEFASAFSAWHALHFRKPVRIDWRSIGGTTEIMRYLESEFSVASSTGIDLFFGGGTYDHGIAASKGFTVPPPWPHGQHPDHLFVTNGITLIPEWVAGEQWRSDTFFGTCISTFGICSNRDRLRDLGIENPPRAWRDLTDPRLFRQIGVADPTKSGSIAKAFEMIIQQECHQALSDAGFDAATIHDFEARIASAGLPPGAMPTNVPAVYQATIEQGWINGLNVIRLIGANARYFTDGAGKVPIDVSNGDAAAGIVIDFYGRYQSEFSRNPDGSSRMDYYTPLGGSSVSADPISLLRGAPHSELAVRFIEFVLSPEGQRLWTYRPGTPGGPRRFALRRLPIRRDFYPAPDTDAIHTRHSEHLQYASDDLADPAIDPYQLAQSFTYYPRWTARHFGVHRMLIRAMALDSGSELQEAWQRILSENNPIPFTNLPPALQTLPDLPEPLTWRSALDLYRNHDRLELMRLWTQYFRKAYKQHGLQP